MTILAPEALASATSPLADAAALLHAAVRDQHDHALTVLVELLALSPVPPSSFGVNSFIRSFRLEYGVELVMPSNTDLMAVSAAVGGLVMVEARTSVSGLPYTRHELSGTRAGVPFVAWSNSYPASAA